MEDRKIEIKEEELIIQPKEAIDSLFQNKELLEQMIDPKKFEQLLRQAKVIAELSGKDTNHLKVALESQDPQVQSYLEILKEVPAETENIKETKWRVKKALSNVMNFFSNPRKKIESNINMLKAGKAYFTEEYISSFDSNNIHHFKDIRKTLKLVNLKTPATREYWSDGTKADIMKKWLESKDLDVLKEMIDRKIGELQSDLKEISKK